MELKVCRKIEGFEQILCEVVTSPLSECISGMDIMSNWGLFPQSNKNITEVM